MSAVYIFIHVKGIFIPTLSIHGTAYTKLLFACVAHGVTVAGT